MKVEFLQPRSLDDSEFLQPQSLGDAEFADSPKGRLQKSSGKNFLLSHRRFSELNNQGVKEFVKTTKRLTIGIYQQTYKDEVNSK